MIYPSIESLMKKADSRYSLVVATAKRARDLLDGAPALVETEADKQSNSKDNIDINKHVAIAIDEIDSGKLELVYQPAVKQAELEEEDENVQQ